MNNSHQRDISDNEPDKKEQLQTVVLSNKANSIVKRYMYISMATGWIPVPLADFGALVASQVKMVHSLCLHYKIPFEKEKGQSLIISMVSGGIHGAAALLGLSSFAKLIPGLGSFAGGGGSSILSGALTYAVGRMFVRHFESGGTLNDLNVDNINKDFKKEFKEGRRIVNSLKSQTKAD